MISGGLVSSMELDFTVLLWKVTWNSTSRCCSGRSLYGSTDFQGTDKSLSEAFILTSTNPQYDNRLSNDLPAQYMKATSSEHEENMMCTQIVFCFDIQNNFCTQYVLPMFLACSFHVLNW